MYRVEELNLKPGDLIEFHFLTLEGKDSCKVRVLRPKYPFFHFRDLENCIIVEYMEETKNGLSPSGEIYAVDPRSWLSFELLSRAKHP